MNKHINAIHFNTQQSRTLVKLTHEITFFSHNATGNEMKLRHVQKKE